jgi:hypothetical protein
MRADLRNDLDTGRLLDLAGMVARDPVARLLAISLVSLDLLLRAIHGVKYVFKEEFIELFGYWIYRNLTITGKRCSQSRLNSSRHAIPHQQRATSRNASILPISKAVENRGGFGRRCGKQVGNRTRVECSIVYRRWVFAHVCCRAGAACWLRCTAPGAQSKL